MELLFFRLLTKMETITPTATPRTGAINERARSLCSKLIKRRKLPTLSISVCLLEASSRILTEEKKKVGKSHSIGVQLAHLSMVTVDLSGLFFLL